MIALLQQDFPTHYNIPIPSQAIVSNSTSELHFELKDDPASLIHIPPSQGEAKYDNPSGIQVHVIHFESFIKSLPSSFQHSKENCDLIVYSSMSKHFLLNELTNTRGRYVPDFVNESGAQTGKRQKAINQLISTLDLLMRVPSISAFVAQHQILHCCFFNKVPYSPPGISAVVAFNRINKITEKGLVTSIPTMQQHGFKFWENLGEDAYDLSEAYT